MPVCKPPPELKRALRGAQLLLPAVGEVGAVASFFHLKSLMAGAGYALFFAEFGLSLIELSHALWEIRRFAKDSVLKRKKGLFEPVLTVTSSSLCLASGITAIGVALASHVALSSTLFWVMPLMLGIKSVAMLISVIKGWTSCASSNPVCSDSRNKMWRILLPKTVLCLCLIAVSVGVGMIDAHPMILIVSAALAIAAGATGLALSVCGKKHRQVQIIPSQKSLEKDESSVPVPMQIAQ